MNAFINKILDVLKNRNIEDRSYFTSAIIAAAGDGTRFSNVAGEKQNTPLNSIPVVVRTLYEFQKCALINEIILVGRTEELELYNSYKVKYGFDKITKIVVGGKTRQESVMNGFNEIYDKSEFVAIHDGARCLVTQDIIVNTLRAAFVHGAATAAEHATDTIKKSNMDGFIEETIDRKTVWLAKTPQVFMTNMYRAAAYMAEKDNISVTDDCMLAERLGFKVKLVECGHENLKITKPEDKDIAEIIISRREDGID